MPNDPKPLTVSQQLAVDLVALRQRFDEAEQVFPGDTWKGKKGAEFFLDSSGNPRRFRMGRGKG